MNYCSQCGSRLEKYHNFCPNCGIKISAIKPEQHQPVNQSNDNQLKVIICDYCGEENSIENLVCSGCGIKLKGKEKLRKDISGDSDNIESGKLKLENSSPKISKNNKLNESKADGSSNKVKELDSKKIILVGSLLGILVLTILFTSGVMDTQTNTPTINKNEQSGVDLNNIQAIEELEQKVKANPDDLESLLHLAHLQNDSRLFEKAIANYKKYLTVKPDDADARVDMGICYYNLNDYSTAINEMESAIKYKPDHQIAHLNLGIVNLSAGNLNKSKEWLKKAIELNPDSDVARRAQELLNSH
jgi:tetratricopeptide (TPR) repeat protein